MDDTRSCCKYFPVDAQGLGKRRKFAHKSLVRSADEPVPASSRSCRVEPELLAFHHRATRRRGLTPGQNVLHGPCTIRFWTGRTAGLRTDRWDFCRSMKLEVAPWIQRFAFKHSLSRPRVVVSQTVCEFTDVSAAELVGYDAGDLRAPCYLPYQSVLCIGGCRTRLDIRAAHVSNGLIRLSDGKTQAPSVSQSWIIVCNQVSNCLCASPLGMCSLSLFRCPGKRFVSVFSST